MADQTSLRARVYPRIAGIGQAAWDACAGQGNPFISYGFLSALEDSGSVGGGTGWHPRYAVLRDDAGEVAAVAPSYAKTHSQGEYVFDHNWANALERAGGKTSLYRKLPRLLRVAVTFFTVMIAWVFFRAGDLHRAGGFLASMFGFGSPQAGADMVSGLLYKPYYLFSLGLAAVVVWTAPDTWSFTRRITWPKVAACMTLFWLALTVLATQEYNPFIYFIF